VPYLSALEVCSRQGAIQIHVYLYLYWHGNTLQEQQHETDREALEQERQRRRELERRLAEEMAKHNEIMEQTIKLREKQKTQAS